MTVGASFDCSTLATWDDAECCGGCHDATADVRPLRVRFPVGYPLGAATLTHAADTTKVLCCRAHLHATMAMAAIGEVNIDALAVTPA